MDIEQILDRIYPLSESSKQILKSHIIELNFPKNHVIIHQDKIEKNFYFIKKGIARTYIQNDGDETTFSFGKEGDTIISFKSYIAYEKGYESVELLEDCTLYKLNTQDLRKLYSENIEIANWGIKFAENLLLRTEDRLLARHFGNAADRYELLLKNYPNLLQRVQLGYIASYLGITQVSLSRIRSNIK